MLNILILLLILLVSSTAYFYLHQVNPIRLTVTSENFMDAYDINGNLENPLNKLTFDQHHVNMIENIVKPEYKSKFKMQEEFRVN
jgi:hypothetical protein